jgi:signal transduction histidine kinase
MLLAMISAAIFGASVAMAVTADETMVFVEKARTHIKTVGAEQAYADFTRTDNEFHQGELYMFCFAPDGMTKAHGGNAKMVGTNMINVRDADGFASTAAIIKVAMDSGSGWTEFKWPNPATKKVERKAAWSVRIDDNTVCASGYYKG